MLSSKDRDKTISFAIMLPLLYVLTALTLAVHARIVPFEHPPHDSSNNMAPSATVSEGSEPPHEISERQEPGDGPGYIQVPVIRDFNGRFQLYHFEISLGEPAQPLRLQVDVTYGALMVNMDCDGAPHEQYCRRQPVYNPGISSTVGPSNPELPQLDIFYQYPDDSFATGPRIFERLRVGCKFPGRVLPQCIYVVPLATILLSLPFQPPRQKTYHSEMSRKALAWT